MTNRSWLAALRRCALVTLVLGAVATTEARAQPTLPTDFVLDTMMTGLRQPTGFAKLPDWRFLIIERRTAQVMLVASTGVATIATIPNVLIDAPERGLLGIDVDPAWPARPFVYLYFTHAGSPPSHHLIRMTASGDLMNAASTNLALSSPYVILNDIPAAASNHNAGTVRFGPDQMLYLSLGDDANACAAQSIDDLRGVVLRMDVSTLPTVGSGPPAKASLIAYGNPFTGPTDNARLTFAYGLRNPYRMNIDRRTGRLFIADVGAAIMEELDVATGGENFGWPWFEGVAPGIACGGTPPSATPPIATLLRAEGQSMIAFSAYRNTTGGANNFGVAYEGDAFYADFYTGVVRRVRDTGNGWAAPPPAPGQPTANDWATGFPFTSQADVLDDGAIYLTNFIGGSFHRIRFVPRLPRFTSATTATTGQSHTLVLERDPGDVAILAMSLTSQSPRPVERQFGQFALAPDAFTFAGKTLDSGGATAVTFASIPNAFAGLTAHFQAIVVSGTEAYISPLHSVAIQSGP